MRDDLKRLARLQRLAQAAFGETAPEKRAAELIELQRLTGDTLRDAIDECIEDGFSWRQIGAAAGVPFQTLQRQYAKGGPIILQAGGAR